MTERRTHYRIYSLDPETRAIKTGCDVFALTDGEALDEARKRHPEGQSFEIWSGQRLVFSAAISATIR